MKRELSIKYMNNGKVYFWRGTISVLRETYPQCKILKFKKL